MKAEISVQVPVKNGGEPFEEFLKSLAVQDLESKWELIIVDDGSQGFIQEEYSALLANLPDNCQVKIIRLDPGGNRPAARNAAYEASESPVGLLMDADLSFPPDLLRKHLEIRKETDSDVIMGARRNAWSPNATDWQRWFDSRAMGHSVAGEFPWNYFITGNLSITNSLLKSIGGFDVAIDCYGGEDTEMGYRLNHRGISFYWDPTLVVDHLDNVSVKKHSEKMLEYGFTGLKYTLKKHPEIDGLLGSNWIKPLFSKPIHLCFIRLITKVALSEFVYKFVLKFVEKHKVPGFVYTYLSVGACLAGLRGTKYNL